ncbi:hypothetical protein ACH4CC_13580 [Streptomyces lydicus]|uniref:hypothetical protein n=1 Tax=Streptomyces lydicus TaxID=47763 RepID=UPI0037ABF443
MQSRPQPFLGMEADAPGVGYGLLLGVGADVLEGGVPIGGSCVADVIEEGNPAVPPELPGLIKIAVLVKNVPGWP